MGLDELKSGLSESEAALKEYVDSTSEYVKLRSFRFFMKILTNSVKALVMGVLLILAATFFSFWVALFLNDYLQSNSLGFLLVGASYLILGIVMYLFRSRLEAPVLKTFSKFYFEE